jgi:hypothetical protein
VKAWRELAADSVDRAAGVRLLLNVRETADPEPYRDAFAMCADIASGHFAVSKAFCDHPIWTPAENVAFRIVHDVLGHFAATVKNGWPADYAGARLHAVEQPPTVQPDLIVGFDWDGENRACEAHGALLRTPDERMALFCECVAQTAYAIDRGGFIDQRCDDLSLWPYEIAPLYADRRDEAISAYASWLDAGV